MEENRFKQRMIGAIVLVALGVIFLPMLLNGETDDGMPLFGSNIPERHKSISQMTPINVTGVASPPPDESQRRELVDEKSAEIPSEKPINPLQNPAQNEPTSLDSKKLIPSEKPLKVEVHDTKAWIVQVGSYTSKKNALSMQNKLRKKKFNAFVEKITTNNGISFRVRIGPQINRNKAEKINLRLKKDIKITGLVMAHPG